MPESCLRNQSQLAARDAYSDAEELLPLLPPLALRRNLAGVLADPLYRSLAPRLEALLNCVHYSDFRPADARSNALPGRGVEC